MLLYDGISNPNLLKRSCHDWDEAGKPLDGMGCTALDNPSITTPKKILHKGHEMDGGLNVVKREKQTLYTHYSSTFGQPHVIFTIRSAVWFMDLAIPKHTPDTGPITRLECWDPTEGISRPENEVAFQGLLRGMKY